MGMDGSGKVTSRNPEPCDRPMNGMHRRYAASIPAPHVALSTPHDAVVNQRATRRGAEMSGRPLLSDIQERPSNQVIGWQTGDWSSALPVPPHMKEVDLPLAADAPQLRV